MPFFPAGSGGAGGLPGLNSATIYCSPEGNDNNDGLTWSTAVRTGYVGYAKIVAAGGGYLNLAAETHWGGPVAGQGFWFRGDGLTVPGFQAVVPCIVTGYGNGPTPSNGFMGPGSAVLYAGSNAVADGRTKPAIWGVRCNLAPIHFFNIQTRPVPGYTDSYSDGNYFAFRMGWDYVRKETGAIDYQAVTSSTRTSTGSGRTADGETVHTVDLLPAVTVEFAERTFNPVTGTFTTLTISRPGTVKSPPWKVGSKIWFETDDPDFTSGDYTITACAAALDDDDDWSITFVDTGDPVGPNADPGTVRSNFPVDGDLIDLESSSAQFPSSQYRVISTTVEDETTGTITVVDYYGGYNGVTNNAGPTSNIGQIACQVRGYNASVGSHFTNCYSFPNGDVAKYTRVGPMWDFAGALAFQYQMQNCYMGGNYYNLASGAPTDPYHCTSLLAMGGELTGPSLYAFDTLGHNATFFIVLSANLGFVKIRGVTTEPGDGYGESPAVYTIQGGDLSYIRIDDASSADQANGYGSALNSIVGIPALNIQGNSIGGAAEGAVGPAADSIIIGATDATTPWVAPMQVGTWGQDLRLTGIHPAGNRQISPAFARFKNLVDPVASWVADKGTVTAGQVDPQGGTGAVKLTDTGDGSQAIIKSGTDVDTTFGAGGRYVVALWANFPDDCYHPALLFGFTGGGDVVWESTGTASWTRQETAPIGGWQYMVFHDVVVSASASQSYSLNLIGPIEDSGLSGYVFGVSAFYVPATIPDNDFYEFIGTLKAQPYYLPPGMAGTFESQKFIAHGGIGTDTNNTKTVGGGSGQLTLTGSGTVYLPVYDADGTTILGWTALLQATVNP